jgi:multidrug efflux pump subunit AcrB
MARLFFTAVLLLLTSVPSFAQTTAADAPDVLHGKEDTPKLIGPIQDAISRNVAGTLVDVRQLQTNPVDYPVELRVTGLADISPLDEEKDIRTLCSIAKRVAAVLRGVPDSARPRDDWGEDGFQITLQVDPDRANLAGATNQDVANSSSAALSGTALTTLRRGDQQIPVVSRLRMEERAKLSDIQNLYVYSSSSDNNVPLLEVSKIENSLQTMRIRHLEHFRTVSVQSFTAPGVLASEVFSAAAPRLTEIEKSLPIGLIFLVLAFQFRHSIKPLLVLAAAPYGVCGSLIALHLMGAPFGFMAFLGIASLIGVIVSHVIVLFDFIEEMHEKGGTGLARRGHRAFATSDDHGRRYRPRTFSSGRSWWTAVAASRLRANWRAWRDHVHHTAVSAGPVFHFCARSRDLG